MSAGTMDEFNFLEKLALKLGAIEAKVVPVSDIVVENRVVLKCRVGCPSYDNKLNCPPYVPSVDEFRKMLKEYRYALLVKYKSKAETDEDVGESLLKCQHDPSVIEHLKEKASKFLDDWKEDKKQIHQTSLELEKAAFNRGYTFAVAFSTGSCSLCEKCNIEGGKCIYPTRVRLPEHAVGVNIKKTAENAGMEIYFPFKKKPYPIALILID
jgi:predicted metal-binding protein